MNIERKIFFFKNPVLKKDKVIIYKFKNNIMYKIK